MLSIVKSSSEGNNGTRMLQGLPTKQISRWVLLLTYEWADLMACAPDKIESVLSTLLRYSYCAHGITVLADQFGAYTFSPLPLCKRECNK